MIDSTDGTRHRRSPSGSTRNSDSTRPSLSCRWSGAENKQRKKSNGRKKRAERMRPNQVHNIHLHAELSQQQRILGSH